MIDTILSLLLLALLLPTLASLGKTILQQLFLLKLDRLQQLALGLPLGLGIFSLIILFLGRFALLQREILLILIAILLIYFSKSSYLLSKELLLLCQKKISQGTKIEIIIIASLGLFSILTLIAALAPAVSIDALHYHLTAAKYYAANGKIDFFPYAWQASQPFSCQMLATFSFALGLKKLAPLFIWVFAPLLMINCYLLGKKFLSQFYNLLFVLLVCCYPFISWQASSFYVELPMSVFALCCCYLFYLTAAKSPLNYRQAILLGIYLGLVAGCKIIGLYFVIAFAFFFFYHCILFRQSTKQIILSSLIIAASFLIVFSPWLIRTWIDTGNPLYPFFSNIFGKQFISQAMLDDIAYLTKEKYGFGQSLGSLLKFPYYLLTAGKKFDYGQLLGPWPMALIFLPLIASKSKRELRPLLLLVIIYFLLWFSGSQQSRFLILIVPLLGLLTIFSISNISSKMLTFLSKLTIYCWLVTSLAINIIYWQQFFPVVFGLQTTEDYLLKKAPLQRDIAYINRTLTKNDKLFFFGRPTYHLKVPFGGGPSTLQGYFDWSTAKSSDALHKRLLKEGYSHIYRDRPNWGYGTGKLIEKFSDQYLTLIYNSHNRQAVHRTFGTKSYIQKGFLYRIESQKKEEGQRAKK